MRVWSIVSLLLLSHTALFSWCAVHKSICVDEGAHLSAGIAYWRWHELSIYDLSPPLMRYWDSLPAYVAGCRIPEAKSLRDESPSARSWIYYDRFEQENRDRLFRYVIFGRFMQLPISLALALGIFAVARRLYGDWPGVLACGIYCLEPNILAHASTLGTDLGITATVFATAIAWQRFLETGKTLPLLLTGLALGAAHSIKFNAPMIFPVLLIMVFVMRRPRIGLLGLAVVGIMSYVLMNLCYGYQLFGRPLNWFGFQSSLMKHVAAILPGGFRVPFSQFLVEGFDAQKWEADGAYLTAFFGKAHFGSDWRYYPFMLLVKTPLIIVVLVAWSAISMFRKRPNRMEIALLLTSVGIFAGMEFLTNVNLGIRYLLPIYPPAIVLAARAVRPGWTWLLTALALETLLVAPQFHSYANPLAGHLYIPDQDYGQSLTDVRDWMRKHDLQEMTLLSVGWTDPSIYGIHYRKLEAPCSEYVAISKAYLTGIPWAFHPEGRYVFVRRWRELQQTKPVADLGGFEIFRAEDTGPEPWVRVMRKWNELLDDPLMVPIEGFQAGGKARDNQQ